MYPFFTYRSKYFPRTTQSKFILRRGLYQPTRIHNVPICYFAHVYVCHSFLSNILQLKIWKVVCLLVIHYMLVTNKSLNGERENKLDTVELIQEALFSLRDHFRKSYNLSSSVWLDRFRQLNQSNILFHSLYDLNTQMKEEAKKFCCFCKF